MSQDDSARLDLPACGQEELVGVSHSERIMADMMKMLANLTMQNQSQLQQHLQQQQQTAAAAGDRGLQQQMAVGEVAEYKSPVSLEKDASSTAGVPSWERPRQNWRACPVQDGKQAWREATQAFGSLVKHP